MKSEATVCYKVSKCLDLLEEGVKTMELDAGTLAELLHGIRRDAQAMENGLKARKRLMSEVGLEKRYQSEKGVLRDKEDGQGINTIKNVDTRTKESMRWEVTIKQNGEVIYQHESGGGVMSFVESISDIDNDGHIEGVCQHYMFGHELSVFFAFDQLRQAMEGRWVQILLKIKEVLGNNKNADPTVKRKILDTVNSMNRGHNAKQ